MLARPQHLHALVEGRDRLLESARAVGPSVVVPTATRWTVRDLVRHVGNVHDWASAVLRTGIEQPQDFAVEPDGIGDDFEGLLDWYADRAGGLIDLLLGGQVPDDAVVWTFGPAEAPSTAAFWSRRQAHEVTIHALDSTLAAGTSVADALLSWDPQISADGVDEVLTVMLPRIAQFVPRPDLPGRLAIQAVDADRRWLLAADGQLVSAAGGSDSGSEPGSEAAATLSGPAGALFALLWRRANLGVDGAELGLSVDGEPAVVDALFAARLTP